MTDGVWLGTIDAGERTITFTEHGVTYPYSHLVSRQYEGQAVVPAWGVYSLDTCVLATLMLLSVYAERDLVPPVIERFVRRILQRIDADSWALACLDIHHVVSAWVVNDYITTLSRGVPHGPSES